MSEIKLLPCPFCGGEAKSVKAHGIFEKPYVVVCENEKCRASVGMFSATKEEAIQQWNTRKPMQEICERLEKLQKEEVPCEGCPFYTKIDCYIHCDEYKLMKVIEIVKEVGGME